MLKAIFRLIEPQCNEIDRSRLCRPPNCWIGHLKALELFLGNRCVPRGIPPLAAAVRLISDRICSLFIYLPAPLNGSICLPGSLGQFHAVSREIVLLWTL